MSKEIEGLIRIRDKEKIIGILTDAFSEYPKLTKTFPQKDRREIAVEANLRFYAVYGMKQGSAYALSENSDGVIIVMDSSKRKASKLRYALSGSYSAKYKQLIAKLTEEEQKIRNLVFEEMTKMEEEIKFPPQYLYVSFVGVKKQYQGSGIGTKMIESLIEEAKKRQLPIVLFTNEPKGVSFYQNLGFRIIGITSSKQFQFINLYLVKG